MEDSLTSRRAHREAMDHLYRKREHPQAVDRWIEAKPMATPDEVEWSNYRYADPARRAREDRFFATIARGAARLLEVAAGTGHFCARLRDFGGNDLRVIGVDLSVEALRLAQRDTGATYVAGDAEHLPFRDGSLDAIMCIASLECFRDPSQGVGEAWRVLRPGGYYYVVMHKPAVDPLVFPTILKLAGRLARQVLHGPVPSDVYGYALGLLSTRRRVFQAVRRLGLTEVQRQNLMSYVDVRFWRRLGIPLSLLLRVAGLLNRWRIGYCQNLTAYLYRKN